MTGDSSLVREIVQRVSDATGKRAVELPPLSDTINPDAVEAIGQCDAAKLQFVYDGYTVTIEVRAPGDWLVDVDSA